MAAIGQSNLLQALGWAVFNSLWQMAILWVAYQLIVAVFRITRSSQKSFLAAFLLFAGFAWFTFTLITALADMSGAGSSYAGLMNIGSNAALNEWMGTMLPVASILYLVLLSLPVLNFIRNYRYVQVIRRYGLSRADVRWRIFVQHIAARMGIRKPVHIWMSELVTSPVTIGYIKPVILLPLAAVNHLTPHQIEAVLLHELSHIRRYDYFINLLTRLIQTVLYFNPFVKAFTRIIEREREKSCDETVIQFQYEPHGYASALLVLEKAAHVPQHSLTVAASDGKKGEFRQRIEWILGIRKEQVFSFNRLAGVLAALLCFIALNAVLIMNKTAKATSVPDRSFTYLSSPYEFFTGDYEKPDNTLPVAENASAPVLNRLLGAEQPTAKTADQPGSAAITGEPEQTAISPFEFVSHIQNTIPQLNEAEEKQVQQALVESKKVLQESQWKEVEYTIADAMTTVEKEKVKEQYEKAVDKIDWQKMGDKLRLSYDRIDWPRINSELTNALTGIRLDSLQQVYTTAVAGLSDLQKELINLNQPAIPDTDITLQCLETKKTELQKVINKIKVVRPKKIIHL
jgi:bla regulator protein blaR1